jgi:glycosyltransferase Alg8
LRTNDRALRLPIRRIGFFTWWSILDQRISIWTTIAGPTSVALTTLFVSPIVLPAYLAWVMLTRYLFCTVLMSFRGRHFPITYPFILYFSQIVGALIKSFVLFRLDRQRWTRQTTSQRSLIGGMTLRSAGSTHMHLLSISWLILGVAYVSGLI